MRTTPSAKLGNYRRRGSMYIMVLGTSMILVTIGVSVIMVSRINLRSTTQANDWIAAGDLAFSAVEHGLAAIGIAPEWRTGYTHKLQTPELSLGRGTFTWMLEDQTDGDLANNDTDPVRLYGIGRVGDTARVHSVLLQPAGGALTCLEVAFSTGGDLALDDATVNCNQIVSSNGNVTGVAASQINGNLEAYGAVTGVAVSGSTTTLTTKRTMPDANTVYDYYNGTPIDINTIPDSHGLYEINGVVLSPTSNPFGEGVTNPKGIYTINAMGYRLEIRDSRIVGTLVILNGSPLCSFVQGAVNWEPAVSNYPALLVQGPLCLYMDGTAPLDETYPSIIKGLVYAESRLDVASHPVVDGVVVSGGIANLTPFTVLDLTFDRTYLDNPPPGFGGGGDELIPARASWRWETMP